jgi:hypothetical protein
MTPTLPADGELDLDLDLDLGEIMAVWNATTEGPWGTVSREDLSEDVWPGCYALDEQDNPTGDFEFLDDDATVAVAERCTPADARFFVLAKQWTPRLVGALHIACLERDQAHIIIEALRTHDMCAKGSCPTLAAYDEARRRRGAERNTGGDINATIRQAGLAAALGRGNHPLGEQQAASPANEWWANTESRRIRCGRWEFYRDKRDWWIGVFAAQRATYFGFLTLIAKRNRTARNSRRFDSQKTAAAPGPPP